MTRRDRSVCRSTRQISRMAGRIAFRAIQPTTWARLFFSVDDPKPYFPQPILNHLVVFPAPVITHLIAYSVAYRPKPPRTRRSAETTRDYRELPTDRLPIVVAARLAMSFPLLISAVPLWAIDYEAPIESRGLSRCWMSDGGLCSNFPIHLFDSFVPRWPTFGISLQKRGKYHLEPVRLAARKTLPGAGGHLGSVRRVQGDARPADGLSGEPVAGRMALERHDDDADTRRARPRRAHLPRGGRGRGQHQDAEEGHPGSDDRSTASLPPRRSSRSLPTTEARAGPSTAGCGSTSC